MLHTCIQKIRYITSSKVMLIKAAEIHADFQEQEHGRDTLATWIWQLSNININTRALSPFRKQLS